MTTIDTQLGWPLYLRRCLSSTYYCALATVGPDGPWVNPLFFSYRLDYSLLFLSLMSSRHMRNIEVNPAVAVTIFSTERRPGEHASAIQMAGQAERVPEKYVPQACAEYFARPGATAAFGRDRPRPADFRGMDPGTWKFVRVTPRDIGYFDSRYFGDERVDVPRGVWQL